MLENNLRYPSPDQIAELRKQVLSAYITQKILLAKAAEESLQVEDRQVDKELETKRSMRWWRRSDPEDQLVEYFGKSMSKIRREMARMASGMAC
jgi:hypothetical protein